MLLEIKSVDKNKMSKKNKNIFSILMAVICFLLIGLLNYIVDPYCVLQNRNYMDFSMVEPENIFIKIKAYQNIPYNTVLIGSSEVGQMFWVTAMTKPYFNCIYGYSGLLNHSNYYDLLKVYIELHPETKNVILVMNYPSLLNPTVIHLPTFSSKSYSLSELIYLFWGQGTTQKSLKIMSDRICGVLRFLLKNKEQNSRENLVNKLKIISISLFARSEQKFEANENWLVSPSVPDQADGLPPEAVLYTNYQQNIEYFDKVFEFLNRKNIKCTVILPPAHVIFFALVNDNESCKKIFESFLRYLTTKTDDIYDFALVNKYTIKDLSENYMYFNYIHPNIIWGSKILKILYNKPEAEKDLCIKLTSKNVEQVIVEQDILLNKYKKDHKDTFEKYKKESLVPNSVKKYKEKNIMYNDLPEDERKEIEYIINKPEKSKK